MPMSDCITLGSNQRITLIREILETGSMLRIKVTGFSMEPFLTSGDIVKMKKVKADTLFPGDLVFFLDRYNTLVLHRLIKKDQSKNGIIQLHTKGDALSGFDEPFKEDHLLAKVFMIEKKNSTRQINLESWHNKTAGCLSALFQRFSINLKAGLLLFFKPILQVMR